MIRRAIAWLLALLLLGSIGIATAEDEGDFPALNDAGFLDSGEFVFEDAENGIWRYPSDTLRVEIYRRDKKSGSLQDTGRRIHVSKPVFVGIQ